MKSSSLLAEGFVWLQSCGSQEGHPVVVVKGHPAFVVKAAQAAGSDQHSHPDFVVKVGKAAGSARRSLQQMEAGKRSDEATPATKTPGWLATPMYESVTTRKQTRA